MRRRNVRVGPRSVITLTVATVIVFGACTADRAPATATPEPTRLVAAPSTTPTPEPTRAVVAPSTSPIPEPTSSLGLGATTLRTIAKAAGPEPLLTIGRELSANGTYSSHAASYTSDGLTISAVLHQPLAPGPHPGVVLVHGFVDASSYTTGGELQREQDYLERAGYVVLYTDLRGLAGSDPAPGGPPDLDMGSVKDVVNAIRALAASRLPGLDGERIGLLGHSLGGLLVIDVLVAKPGLVDAVVAFAPASTVVFENVERYLTPGDPIYEAVIAAHRTPQTNPAYWADISPRTFADQASDPLLIVHGDADADVPIEWSVETVAAWRNAGKAVEFVTLRGEDHVFDARWDEAMTAVTAFFAGHLD